ncbi:oxygenase MpaB family protein [Hymenobacter sp. GOD-10R]|uniref:oxygenase MpaB family protein n=1 Tax=Hymenobacter sp. GOD-10R TaxID=3093922 RepID=UPI002D7A2CD6|nr:oxygenase MpaB family protein [Hymenobacter sp. GOD-10R]WRQ30338.1 oxygenase MpaB family protein [Hymenobacter sp. GOD-10R]
MEYFVAKHSIVRTIWGKADTVLFIFAGAAAEFALNKAVDWLYFTGRLPADPLGRLFSTVEYARQIVFAPRVGAEKAIDTITAIHGAVEAKRGAAIPAWAYRDVLFMLIDYSIRSFEALERLLTTPEKEEVFHVFNRVGLRMGIPDLPTTYAEWLVARAQHLSQDLAHSHYTDDLFQQYRRHLGPLRYWLLLQGQRLVLPEHVRHLLGFGAWSWLRPVVPVYRHTHHFSLSQWIKTALLPTAYKAQIQALDAQ